MRKKIQKYGNSIVIRINPQEAEIYKLKVGDIIDIKIKKEKIKEG